MIVFVSGASRTLDRYADRPWLGSFVQPRVGTAAAVLESRWRERGWLWACDNGAFKAFDHVAYVRMVRRLWDVPGMAWLAVPDEVGDCQATAGLFLEYWHMLHCWGNGHDEREMSLAWVAQDGAEDHRLSGECMSLAQCVFLGGSTEWKESAAAASVAAEAVARGLWVHMGRVNSLRRLRIAFEFGCDSVDGTGISMYPDVVLGQFDRWMRRLLPQPLLF